MAPVRARVLAWLASHDEGDVETIARDITTRTSDVRDALRKLLDEGLVAVDSRGADPRSQSRVYCAASVASDGLGRASAGLSEALAAMSGRSQPSHCDQILSLLADGTVWSSYELHRRVFCVLHSRIADLRKKLKPLGFHIEHTGGGAGTDEHYYQLIRVAPLSAPSPGSEDRGMLRCFSSDDRDGALSGAAAEPPDAALHADDQQLDLLERAA